MLAPFPAGLHVAFIDAEKFPGKKTTSRRKYWSCLIDPAAPVCAPKPGGRAPKYRIELPGPPILGDGKGDNQNHAIVFSRGSIIQAIDANQEGYLEEALKLSCALREFDGEAPPAILGFGEHIFSGLGALGDFAATAELAFGTLVQSTMSSVLQLSSGGERAS